VKKTLVTTLQNERGVAPAIIADGKKQNWKLEARPETNHKDTKGTKKRRRTFEFPDVFSVPYAALAWGACQSARDVPSCSRAAGTTTLNLAMGTRD
jgi:hypothetical protein